VSGAKCWCPDSPHYTHIWDMIPQFCPENYHGNWLLIASDEWRKMLDAWAWFCFQMPGFFIVHTADMGLGIVVFNLMSRYLLISCIVCFYSLGIQAAKTVKTCKLSEFLHGFLEIITEDQFRQLKRLHYPSLYAMKYHRSAVYFGLTIISLCLKVDHFLQ
jgi:hypothetical protein